MADSSLIESVNSVSAHSFHPKGLFLSESKYSSTWWDTQQICKHAQKTNRKSQITAFCWNGSDCLEKLAIISRFMVADSQQDKGIQGDQMMRWGHGWSGFRNAVKSVGKWELPWWNAREASIWRGAWVGVRIMVMHKQRTGPREAPNGQLSSMLCIL